MTKTTTLKLDERLRKRIAPLAHAAHQTAHAWMVSALEAQAELAEQRRAFLAAAQASASEVERTGELFDADQVHAYFLARTAGVRTRRPRPIKRRTRR